MSLKIEILKTEQELFAIKNEWQNLVERVQPDSIFLTYEWQMQWWQNYHQQFEHAQPAIITVRDNQEGALLALLPLFSHVKTFRAGQRFRTLQLMGTEIEPSDYLDIICPPEKKVAFLRKIFAEPRVLDFVTAHDVLILENIDDNSSLLLEKNELDNLLNSVSYQYKIKVCPYLSLPETTEALLAGLSRNFRSNLKRARNKLKRHGFQIETVTREDQLDAAIENLFSLHDRRFQAKQADSKFNYQRRGNFHKLVARTFLKNDWLQLYQILDRQKVVGSLYCFKFNHSMMYVQGGFDPDYAQYGLGNQIILKAIEDAIALKFRKFDFMRGAEAYKFKWTKEKRDLHRIIIPLSLRAKIYFAAEDLALNFKNLIKKIIKRQ